jgi:hypothetical protein
VASVTAGVAIDLTGPDNTVTDTEYENVLAAFPKMNFLSGGNQTVVELCATKSNSTYGLVVIPAVIICVRYQIGANDDDSWQIRGVRLWRCLRVQLFCSWASYLRHSFQDVKTSFPGPLDLIYLEASSGAFTLGFVYRSLIPGKL